MTLTKHEIYVKALLEGYEDLQEKKLFAGKWHLADELMTLDRAIEMADLTDKQRKALRLVYFEYMEHSEASALIGTSRVNVTLHIGAAIKKIANIYEKWEALEYVN